MAKTAVIFLPDWHHCFDGLPVGHVDLPGGVEFGHCVALMPYSQDSDNVEVECGIATIESEISGCLHAARVAGPRVRRTRLTTTIHARPMMGDTNRE